MSFASINPATGETIATFATMTDREIVSALASADACFHTDWKRRPVAERSAVMARAAALLRQKREEYAGYTVAEMGQPFAQALYEVDLSADILDYYASNAAHFLAPREVPGSPGASVLTEPVGVILAIEPWNFPYYQLARVAGPQIVAGNVVMTKHAGNVPQCALAFARLFAEAGAPGGVYTNLFCTVDQIGTLIDDFRVRGVTLTGSERAGAAVAERAGRALKKVVLELGGNDPMIVLGDADLDMAVDMAVTGRTFNTGQACISTKRLIVVGAERGKQVLDTLITKFGDLVVGDPADEATAIGPIVSEGALEQLLDQVGRAKGAGATIVCGGRRIDRPGFYMEPTIITGIDEGNPLYREEAFGPVLSFYTVNTEEEAIRLANDSPYGLGAALIGADVDHARAIADRIDAGMVFINSFAHSVAELPFGGVKNSGFGRELGEAGIGEFVNRKLIRVA